MSRAFRRGLTSLAHASFPAPVGPSKRGPPKGEPLRYTHEKSTKLNTPIHHLTRTGDRFFTRTALDMIADGAL